MQVIEHKKQQQVQCPRCEYDWFYNGHLGYASCPNCRYNVKVEANRHRGGQSGELVNKV